MLRKLNLTALVVLGLSLSVAGTAIAAGEPTGGSAIGPAAGFVIPGPAAGRWGPLADRATNFFLDATAAGTQGFARVRSWLQTLRSGWRLRDAVTVSPEDGNRPGYRHVRTFSNSV